MKSLLRKVNFDILLGVFYLALGFLIFKMSTRQSIYLLVSVIISLMGMALIIVELIKARKKRINRQRYLKKLKTVNQYHERRKGQETTPATNKKSKNYEKPTKNKPNQKESNSPKKKYEIPKFELLPLSQPITLIHFKKTPGGEVYLALFATYQNGCIVDTSFLKKRIYNPSTDIKVSRWIDEWNRGIGILSSREFELSVFEYFTNFSQLKTVLCEVVCWKTDSKYIKKLISHNQLKVFFEPTVLDDFVSSVFPSFSGLNRKAIVSALGIKRAKKSFYDPVTIDWDIYYSVYKANYGLLD